MLSIIIPIYNRIENLKKVLHGLSLQTSHDFEVIIVDDGSTDGAGNWLAHAKKNYTFDIKYKYYGDHNDTEHKSHVRNEGCRMALSTTIGYLFNDSDVIMAPDAVEKYLAAYAKDPNRVIVGMYHWGAPVETSKEDIDDFETLLKDMRRPLVNPGTHGMQGIRDIRERSFLETTPDELHWDQGTALSCFGGNLFVPKHIFIDVAKGQMEANSANKDLFCGFDEGITAPVEDGDFGQMIKKRGWAISLHSGISGYHLFHPRNIPQIVRLSQEQIGYVDSKYKINIQEDTKINNREEYKL